MTRSVWLGIGSVAVFGGLFVLYTFIVQDPGNPRGASPVVQELPQATELTGAQAVQVGDGSTVSLPKGEGAGVTIYDEKTGEPVRRFEYAEWRPVNEPGADRQFWVREPKLILRLPGSSKMVATITADEGQIAVERIEKTQSGWKYGWLKGNARIVLERAEGDERITGQGATSRDSGSTEPAETGVAAGNGRTEGDERITIEMPELSFDLDLGRLNTAGTIRATSSEFEIEGSGLDLTWNQAANRVEQLRIATGKQLVLRRASGLLNADERSAGEEQAIGGNAEGEEESPVRARHRRKEREKPRVTYLCTLAGPVIAEQFGSTATEETGGASGPKSSLEASELRLIFEMGGGAAKQEATTRPARTGDPRLVVRWSGPLTLTPTEVTSSNVRVPGARQEASAAVETEQPRPARRRLEAMGPVVTLRRGDSEVRCGRLEYHDDTGRVWLGAGPDGRVHMRMGPRRSASAASIFIDRAQNLVKLVGEVRLDSTRVTSGDAAAAATPEGGGKMRARSSGGSSIRCSQIAELTLYSSEAADSAVIGEELTELTGAIRSAAFVGDVDARLGEQEVRAGRLDLAFRAGESGEAFEDLITSAVAAGSVRMAQEAEAVECGRIDITFGRTEAGAAYPSEFTARGAVRITQAEAGFADWVKRLGQGRGFEEIGERLNPARMFSAARPARLTGDTLVCTLAAPVTRSEAEAGSEAERGRLRLKTLDVSGRASIHEPERGVAARGRQITAGFLDGNRIDTAAVLGTAEQPGLVRALGYTIRGERIDLSAETRELKVVGPSRISFPAERSLQGERRARPTRVVVEGRDLLHIDGKGNQVRIEGDVVARSGPEQLRAAKMTLWLEDVRPAGDAKRARSGLGGAGVLPRVLGAVFQPASGGASGRRGQRGGGADGERAGMVQIDESSTRKEPIRLTAELALAVTETIDPGLGQPVVHSSLEAPRLEIDIVHRQMHTVGPTSLLLTDYRIEDGSARGSPDTGFVPSDLMSAGPSQTIIVCDTSLVYVLGTEGPDRRDSVLMEGGVYLHHRAGSEVDLAKTPLDGRINRAALEKLGQRNTQLKSDRLECQFARGAAKPPSARTAPAGPGFRLAWLLATGTVQLIDRQGPVGSEIFADRLAFDRRAGLVGVAGSNESDARIYRWDERKGKFSTPYVGRELEYDLVKNTIRASKGFSGQLQP